MSANLLTETVAEEELHVEGLDGTGRDMSRIISVSDAMFAFSMTFLVITLVLPQVGAANRYPNLLSYFSGEWPSMVAYMISFFVISSWWGTHRRLFSPIVRYDPTLVRLNNLFLLVIAITPFLVGILYDYGPGSTVSPGSQSTQFAVVIFAAAQVTAGLLLLAIWRHSTRGHRLVEERLPESWVRGTEKIQTFYIAVFAVSIPIAFASPFIAELAWIAMVFGGHHLRIRLRRRRRPVASPPPVATPGR